MVEFKCQKCSKTFHHKSHYDNHINRKTSCIKCVNSNNMNKPNDFRCDECNIGYSSLSGLNKHLHYYCKAKLIGKNNLAQNNNNVSSNSQKDTKENLIKNTGKIIEIDQNFKIPNKYLSKNDEKYKNLKMTGEFVLENDENSQKKSEILDEMNINQQIECYNCNKLFDSNIDLDEHKLYCKKQTKCNNIYKFDTKTFGKYIFRESINAGDLYIMQTDFEVDDIFKIGATKNLYSKLNNLKIKTNYEPRLHFYFPCKNIELAETKLGEKLAKYNIEKDIYNSNLDTLKTEILNLLKEINDNNCFAYEPEFRNKIINKCEYCDKIFMSKQDKFTHTKKCEMNNKKGKQAIEEEILKQLINEMNQIKKENHELKNEIGQLKNTNGMINSNNTTNNNNNQQNIVTNTFNIVAFGKEKLDEIVSDEMCKKILFRGFEAVPQLIEYVHFNEKKPEYHNCYIPNMRAKYAIVYDGNNWKLKDAIDVIEELRDSKKSYLETKFDSFYESLDSETKKKFERFLSEAETDTVINRYKESLRLLLYNKKDIVIKTKKVMENKKKSNNKKIISQN